MKLLKRLAKFSGLLLIIALASGALFIFFSVPQIPSRSNQVIDSALSRPLKEVLKGKTGYAKNKGVKIWYESIIPKDPLKNSRGTILLIMGISTDALAWPERFIEAFTDSGYQVIGMDHRGTGMSDWDIEKPYTLSDMAMDGIEVLNVLGVKKAHVIGLSMGGMIAQQMAIEHPERVATLISIMSSCNIKDPELPPVSDFVFARLIAAGLRFGVFGGEKDMIKLNIAGRMILRGTAQDTIDTKEMTERVLYNLRRRKGYNPKVFLQHKEAILMSGSRCEKLKKLNLPALIIHGKQDELMPIAHGKKCAEVIPGAIPFWVDNMGHDISDRNIKAVAGKILETIK